MPDWIIVSASDVTRQTVIADAPRAHAEQVMNDLRKNGTFPLDALLIALPDRPPIERPRRWGRN